MNFGARLAATAVLVCGCNNGSDDAAGDAAKSRSRFQAIAAESEAPVDVQEFCETYHPPESAPELTWPPLRSPATPREKGKSQWINVWATWCKPCIEEFPRLTRWRTELAAQTPFELVFLSADGEAGAVDAFAGDHPEVADSLEIDDAAQLDPWLAQLGLQGTSVLPVHLFVDAESRVRCIRMAGIRESDRAGVAQILAKL